MHIVSPQVVAAHTGFTGLNLADAVGLGQNGGVTQQAAGPAGDARLIATDTHLGMEVHHHATLLPDADLTGHVAAQPPTHVAAHLGALVGVAVLVTERGDIVPDGPLRLILAKIDQAVTTVIADERIFGTNAPVLIGRHEHNLHRVGKGLRCVVACSERVQLGHILQDVAAGGRRADVVGDTAHRAGRVAHVGDGLDVIHLAHGQGETSVIACRTLVGCGRLSAIVGDGVVDIGTLREKISTGCSP